MATLTYASHVKTLGGFKRPLNSPGDASAAKALRTPTGALPGGAPFNARTDRGTNTTVPVARSAITEIVAGEVAFVDRSDGVGSGVLGPLAMAPIVTLEQLNEELAKPDHLLENNVVAGQDTPAGLVEVDQSAVPSVDPAARTQWRFEKVKVFAPFYNKPTTNVPEQHPIRKYALDGVVSTTTETDCINLNMRPQFTCNVAVKGPSVFNVRTPRYARCPSGAPIQHQMSVGADPIRAHRTHYFVKPVRMRTMLYVVLVADRVDVAAQGTSGTSSYVAASVKWRLRYEVVSQSQLDTDVETFRATLQDKTKKQCLAVFTLGTVTDTRFGPGDGQLMVNVSVGRYERVEHVGVTVNGVDLRNATPVHADALFSSDALEDRILAQRQAIALRLQREPAVPKDATGNPVPLPRKR
jgi:hypothetical protein